MLPRFRLAAVLIIAALPLVSCATPAERQLHKVSVASEQLWAQYDACRTRVEGTGAYQRLDQAYILKKDDPRSVEKMAIERLASQQEKADVLANKKNTDRCNQGLFRGFAEINPGFNVLLARFMSEDDELDLRTVQDEVTVGERNLIVHQRFAKRLRDWNFAGERLVRLYAWRLRRTCSIYCSSFTAASLLPTSTEGISNLASVTPLPSTDGQEAGLPQFGAAPEPVTQAPALAAAPAAPAVPAEPKTAPSTEAAAPVLLTPAVPEPKTAPKPTALAPAVTPLPGAPKPTTDTAAAEIQSAMAPAVKQTKPSPATAPVATAAPTAQKPEAVAKSLAEKPASAAAPAAREAETPAKSATQTTNSAPKPPTRDADTGLKPAAGPADEPKTPKKQHVQVASVPKKAKWPVYTVHLASMQSEVEARAEWGQLQASYPAILGDRVLFTREVEVEGKGTFVRVLTGLFHDRAQAKGLCGQLGGRDQYCAVLRL